MIFLAHSTCPLQVLIGVEDLAAVKVIGSTAVCGEDSKEQLPSQERARRPLSSRLPYRLA